jgi:hypothetical protein
VGYAIVKPIIFVIATMSATATVLSDSSASIIELPTCHQEPGTDISLGSTELTEVVNKVSKQTYLRSGSAELTAMVNEEVLKALSKR